MTTKADWEFRATHLDDAALALERQADKLRDEAGRLRGLAEQARALVRLGDGEGWRKIDSAPRDRPIQVWAQDQEHHWLPFTAVREHERWTRPASRDGLPFAPTHWRELPATPRS